MDLLTVAVVLAAVFVTCRWSGRQLAHHYQDGVEVAAVVAIGVCVLGSLVLLPRIGLAADAVQLAGLVGAGGGGLFAGFLREDVPH